MLSSYKVGLIAALLGATALAAVPLAAQEATAPATEAPATETPVAEAAAEAEGLLTADELDQLFGPVALYPDTLLAQVLLSTTYPLDVMKADRFLLKNADMTDEARVDAVNKETWADPVKQLAAGFPELINRMAEHADWVDQAGNALIGQTDASLEALQRLRAQAKLNGYLEDNEAMNVEESEETGDITISAADPEVVYVPQYTETVYTQPAPASPVYVTDDDDWDDYLMTGAIVWGGAIILDEIFDDDWDGDDWGGGYGGNDIDWNGDVNIDNGINIGNGNVGDRPGIGEGGGLGGGVGGGAVAGGIAGGIAGGALNRPSTRPATGKDRIGGVDPDRAQNRKDGNFRPSDASQNAARDKIKSSKAAGGGVSTLPAATGKGDRVGKAPSTGKAKTSAAARSAKPKAKAPPKVSKPKSSSRPKASTPKKSAKKPAYKPSSGSKARASSSRGRSSGGGGGGRRR